MLRNIVQIDVERCNGCGLCISNCVEGALKIIDGKARLVNDIYCDGLGACLGHCPQDAITIIKKEVDEFKETAFLSNEEDSFHTINQDGHISKFPVHHGRCLGSKMMVFENSSSTVENDTKSQLRQWPIQLTLVPINFPCINNSDLLITADCVPFAYANYHQELLKGKSLIIGCPKLDDIEYYIEKLTEIFKLNRIHSVTIAHMEVPCCIGLVKAVEMAMRAAQRNIPIEKVTISINGNRI